ncbi:MAG: glycosyltransferase [Pseudomonas sp.]|uniref:glycosyltransferase n=1 Tax=Pseudomonas abieticivorans TaxID=2931382 RepID=UPI0020BD7DD2|nr:glycosyltransferase [Pseudomonas sp. PIA16]MDE1166660.1 glycosyltransferase [Pseudomonas sp.]
MRIILIAIGSAGDVFPFIGLGRALRQGGHRVTLCSMPAFREAIEQQGLEFVPVCDAQTYESTMSDPRLWAPKTSFAVLWQAIASMLEPVYDYVVSQRHDDIVVVGSLWALGARIAHEKYGIPYLSVQVSPSTLLSAHVPPVHPSFNVSPRVPLTLRKWLWRGIEYLSLDRVVAPQINALRAKVGLKVPVRRVFSQWMHAPQGVLCLFPEWFAAAQMDWPKPLTLAGFPLFDGSETAPLDAGLQAFLQAGEPPVVFTTGSTEHFDERFYRLAINVLGQVGARGIFLTGGREPLQDLPAFVLQRRFVPMSSLLPKTCALVHPGGIGAMSLALAAGIPQVVMPVAHDQFDNAERLHRLGCGVKLGLPLKEADLHQALLRMLLDADLAQACEHARALSGPSSAAFEVACTLIERCHRRYEGAALAQAS